MKYRMAAVPAEIRTKLDNLNLIDRFLFNETAENPAAYRAMVEILTGEDVSMITWNETEKELAVSPQLRAVRLDVIGQDEKGSFYQMEMQKKDTKNLPKRSRFYQGQIDVSLLDVGCKDFNKLNDLTMILVAPFDIFGYGLYRYTFCGHCEEIPELKLEDGAKRIFINTHGTNAEDFSQEFLDFMKYINASTEQVAEQTASPKIQLIHDIVSRIRESEKIGVKYMQWWEEKAYARDEGYEEGGRDKLLALTQKKLAKGKSIAEIADALEESEETIRELIAELKNT